MSRAFWTYFRLKTFSSAELSDGLPTGQVIANPLRIREEPTDFAISTTAQICVTGIPTRSISFTIVDPQRVLVPQVDVRIAALIP